MKCILPPQNVTGSIRICVTANGVDYNPQCMPIQVVDDAIITSVSHSSIPADKELKVLVRGANFLDTSD